jgi:diguanylate cyclase (GGDEF)-like protein
METETMNPETGYDPFIDSLSGLLGQNRTAELYQDALDIGLPVLFIDIDHFKAINDIFSYNAGDTVIKDLGRMIRMFFPENQAGRKGGDEFIVVFENDSAEAREKAYKFINYVEKYLTVRSPTGWHYSVTVSAGYAKGFVDFDTMFPACEYLLKQAKRHHKNCLALFAENECIFRRGSLTSPMSRKYLAEYSFVQSRQFLELFRWYHAPRINKHFNKTLDKLLRMMNDIAL